MEEKEQKKKKQRKVHFWDYLNPKNLQSQVKRYGGDFSPWTFLRFAVILYGIAIGLVLAFRIQLAYATLGIAIISVFLPCLFVNRFKRVYEIRRFEEISAYMDQMLYSFKRRNKILSALEDTRSLFGDDKESIIYRTISSAIEAIWKNGDYEKAFESMETYYNCERLKKMHRFLIMVENIGGNCNESIDILIQDKNLWTDRINLLQKEQANIRIKTVIGLGISLLVCYLAAAMLPAEFSVAQTNASQITTVAVFLSNFFIWYFADKKLSDSLISEEQVYSSELLRKSYRLVFYPKPSAKARKTLLVKSLILLPVTILCVWSLKTQGIIVSLIAYTLILTDGKRKFKVAYKRLCRHVERVYPEWLMGVALRLQTDNLFVAMRGSMEEADEILREELEKLLDYLRVAPDSLEPYVKFMDKLYLPDMTSAMRMLYSLGAYGSEDKGGQITALNSRNVALIDKAEGLKMEDKLMGIGMMILIPMITGVVKLIVDLSLTIGQITNMSNMI